MLFTPLDRGLLTLGGIPTTQDKVKDKTNEGEATEDENASANDVSHDEQAENEEREKPMHEAGEATPDTLHEPDEMGEVSETVSHDEQAENEEREKPMHEAGEATPDTLHEPDEMGGASETVPHGQQDKVEDRRLLENDESEVIPKDSNQVTEMTNNVEDVFLEENQAMQEKLIMKEVKEVKEVKNMVNNFEKDLQNDDFEKLIHLPSHANPDPEVEVIDYLRGALVISKPRSKKGVNSKPSPSTLLKQKSHQADMEQITQEDEITVIGSKKGVNSNAGLGANDGMTILKVPSPSTLSL